MNEATKEISRLLNVSIEEAVRIQRRMEDAGLDFSECTKSEFRQAARDAQRELTCAS